MVHSVSRRVGEVGEDAGGESDARMAAPLVVGLEDVAGFLMACTKPVARNLRGRSEHRMQMT